MTIASCSRSKESMISPVFGAVGNRLGPRLMASDSAHDLILLTDPFELFRWCLYVAGGGIIWLEFTGEEEATCCWLFDAGVVAER